MRRTAIGLAVAVLLAAALAPYWTAAALIVRVAAGSGLLGTLSRWAAVDVSSSVEQIPTRSGSIRARVFRPRDPVSRAVFLVSGVHRDGIDERRLTRLAGELAATGRVVVTPEIDDLIHYRITARVTDTIEDAARWMTMRHDVFGTGRIGVIGVSFSGGLSIVASGRPSVRDQIAYVLSFGGHGNLPRVLRYLCTGNGGSEAPHPYTLAVVLHQSAELVVPVEQVAGLRDTIEIFSKHQRSIGRTLGERSNYFLRSDRGHRRYRIHRRRWSGISPRAMSRHLAPHSRHILIRSARTRRCRRIARLRRSRRCISFTVVTTTLYPHRKARVSLNIFALTHVRGFS